MEEFHKYHDDVIDSTVYKLKNPPLPVEYVDAAIFSNKINGKTKYTAQIDIDTNEYGQYLEWAWFGTENTSLKQAKEELVNAYSKIKSVYKPDLKNSDLDKIKW